MMFFTPHQRDDLLKRVRPGRPHTGSLCTSINGCFELAEQVASERMALRTNMELTDERRREIMQDFLSEVAPKLAVLSLPAKSLKAQVEAGRPKKGETWPMPREVADLNNDVAALDAALFFTKREMQSVSGMRPEAFDSFLFDRGV